MYKSYKEYINQREEAVTKLINVVPNISKMVPLITAGIKMSKKHHKLFDAVKTGMEKQIGHPIEYAEVDIYMQVLSAGVMSEGGIENPLDTGEIVKAIYERLGNVIVGLNNKELIEDSKELANQVVEHITGNIEE